MSSCTPGTRVGRQPFLTKEGERNRYLGPKETECHTTSIGQEVTESDPRRGRKVREDSHQEMGGVGSKILIVGPWHG